MNELCFNQHMNLMFANEKCTVLLFISERKTDLQIVWTTAGMTIQKAACNMNMNRMKPYQGRASVFASSRSDLPIYFCRRRNEKPNYII